MYNYKNRSLFQTILACIKYFIVIIAFIFPIISIGNVINDARSVHPAIIRTLTNSVDIASYRQNEWFNNGEISFPEKYVIDPAKIDICQYDNCTSDIDALLVIIGICYICAMAILMVNIFTIISENTRLYSRYIELCDEMDDAEQPFIAKALETKLNKKILDTKTTIVLPIILAIVAIISMTLTISQYGGRMSSNINGIIRTYGLEYSEETMDAFNNIDDIAIDIDVSLHPNRVHDVVDGNIIRSIASATGTYFRGTKVINHRMIPHGMIVCVKLDMAKYYIVIVSQISLLTTYFIYLIWSLFDISPIIRFQLDRKYNTKGR